MSYIDTFDYEFIGFFGLFPVYHPLVAVEGAGGDEFSCTPTQLVIGGGGGEHLGLVIQKPEMAAEWFISKWVGLVQEGKLKPQDPIPSDLLDQWDRYFEEHMEFPESILHFAGWNVEIYYHFFEDCSSSAFYRPFIKEEDVFFEHWITISVGEFVFYAMTDLAPTLDTHYPEVRKYVKDVLYMNILLPPPGYLLPHGRKLVDGKVVWGNIRWWPQNR